MPLIPRVEPTAPDGVWLVFVPTLSASSATAVPVALALRVPRTTSLNVCFALLSPPYVLLDLVRRGRGVEIQLGRFFTPSMKTSALPKPLPFAVTHVIDVPVNTCSATAPLRSAFQYEPPDAAPRTPMTRPACPPAMSPARPWTREPSWGQSSRPRMPAGVRQPGRDPDGTSAQRQQSPVALLLHVLGSGWSCSRRLTPIL